MWQEWENFVLRVKSEQTTHLEHVLSNRPWAKWNKIHTEEH